MAVPKTTIWELDPHTTAKHEILRRYLSAWFPILASRNGRIIYIDGFCGPGRYSKGEIGSPLIALNVAMQNSVLLSGSELVFLFMDKDADRVAHLEQELAALSFPRNFTIIVKHGEFQDEFRKMLDGLDQRQQRLAPTFAFIDPFGFSGLPFELVERLLRRPQTEVLINFMIDSVNRFIEHPTAAIREEMDCLFGLHDAASHMPKMQDRVMALRLLYQQQLLKVAKFVRFFEMRNDRDRTIYYLYFATNHSLGHTKMKEAFWRVDPSSGSCYSDATNPNQMLLFAEGVDMLLPSLANEIKVSFAGKTVRVADVLAFVNETTGFIEKHAKAALRSLEAAGRIAVRPIKADGKPRSGKTFPAEVIVTFGARDT